MSGYPNSLMYYMWGYQVHYRIACQTKSESMFDKLDRSLTPFVFLLGIDKEGKHFNIEPETSEHLLSLFENLDSIKQQIHEADPYKDMLYGAPGMQEEMDTRHAKEYRRQAMEDILNKSEDGSKRMFFVSDSVPLADNDVFIVISLDRAIFNSHTHLKTKFFNERYRIYTSLLETAANVFLADCARNLYLPDPGKSLGFDGRPADEMLRSAARELMYTFSSKGKKFEGLHGLFDACNNLSIHRYEGNENLGTIIIAANDHDCIDYTLELQNVFSITDLRKTRKLMQLTTEDVGLICNTRDVLGLGKIKSTYNAETESIFKIRFRGIHCWDVFHDETAILVMRYGLPSFQTEVIDKSKFASDCRRIFKGISQAETDNLYALSVGAAKQKNGALVVFTDAAAIEADRLKARSIPIKPLKLNQEGILNLTAIDGAVLVDRTGMAFAHGVILDGIVTQKGDAARGSRYNSAVTYIENNGSKFSALAIVVSEDGMVDVLPELRPQVSRKEIESVVTMLEKQVDAYDGPTYRSLMEFLRRREFYLSAKQCAKINSIKEVVEKRPFEDEGLRRVYDDLNPNQEMNNSYYLD